MAADHMRPRSLNNQLVDRKTRYVAFISTAGIKNGKYFDMHSPAAPSRWFLSQQSEGSTCCHFTRPNLILNRLRMQNIYL